MTDEYDLYDVSYTVRGLPYDHHDSTLRNFDWSLQKDGIHEAVDTYLEDMQDFIHGEKEESPNLYVFGPPGNGKTHLSCALWKWAVLRTDAGSSHWIHVPSFVEDVKQSYNREGPGPMESIRQADVFLGLDDLFGADLSQHDRKILSRIIDTAHQNGASIVATTNLNLSKARGKLHEHEISRLLANGTPLKFQQGDQRL